MPTREIRGTLHGESVDVIWWLTAGQQVTIQHDSTGNSYTKIVTVEGYYQVVAIAQRVRGSDHANIVINICQVDYNDLTPQARARIVYQIVNPSPVAILNTCSDNCGGCYCHTGVAPCHHCTEHVPPDTETNTTGWTTTTAYEVATTLTPQMIESAITQSVANIPEPYTSPFNWLNWND